MKHTVILVFASMLILLSGCSLLNHTQKIKHYVQMETNHGDIVIGLYEATPIHTNHFIELCNNHIYDSLLFHKVIPASIIIGGNPESKTTSSMQEIESIEIDSSMPSEIVKNIYNTRGKIGAWRAPTDINPEKHSHPSTFYIVEGSKFPESQINLLITRRNLPKITDYMTVYLNKNENKTLKDSMDYYLVQRMNNDYKRLFIQTREIITPMMEAEGIELFDLSKKQKKLYSETAGIPYMDGEYTIFGEIVHGLSIVDKISEQRVGLHFRPKNEIIILSTRVLEKKEWKQMKKSFKNADKN